MKPSETRISDLRPLVGGQGHEHAVQHLQRDAVARRGLEVDVGGARLHVGVAVAETAGSCPARRRAAHAVGLEAAGHPLLHLLVAVDVDAHGLVVAHALGGGVGDAAGRPGASACAISSSRPASMRVLHQAPPPVATRLTRSPSRTPVFRNCATASLARWAWNGREVHVVEDDTNVRAGALFGRGVVGERAAWSRRVGGRASAGTGRRRSWRSPAACRPRGSGSPRA